MSLSEQIKASLSLVDEFRRDGSDLRKIGAQYVTLCPFHQEKTPSCYVSPETGRFRCFGCGANGTVIDVFALKHGITPADAIRELAARLSITTTENGSAPIKCEPRPEPLKLPGSLPKLPDLDAGSVSELVHLAKLRNLAVEALQLSTSRGLLWFCNFDDGPITLRAWVITDRTRKNAQARRLDGQRWRHAWDSEAKRWVEVEPERRRKVRGFTGNQASWPVGIGEAQRFGSIAIVEGVDLLAAFHFLVAEEREEQVAPVAILGASNRIPSDARDFFAGKRIRIFPHANQAGLNAAVRWEAQLLPIRRAD